MIQDEHSGARLTLLNAALSEANAVVRSYDTKAQIAAVGYIFSLGIAGGIQELMPVEITLTTLKVIFVWVIFMVPVLQFGFVLYPTRASVQGHTDDETGVLFLDGKSEIQAADLADSVRQCDPVLEYAGELFRVARLRNIKRRRFVLGLSLTMIAYAVLFTSQVIGV